MTEGPGETGHGETEAGDSQAAGRHPARLRQAILGRRGMLGGRPGAPAADGETAAPSAGGHGGGLLARVGHLEYDRILFFSDAVFAIAITLLVVDLPERLETGPAGPVDSGAVLHGSVASIVGFGISFAAIGLFWLSHHSFYRFVTGFDRPLLLLNLLFLGTIAFLPYPTALLSRTTPSQAPAVIFYAACIGMSGLLLTVAWGYACLSPAGLVAGLDRRARWYSLISVSRIPVVFGASIAIAPFSPAGAQYFWLTTVAADFVLNRLFGPVRGANGPAPEDAAQLPPD
jgi:uncharacterized membrane protein